MTAAWTCPGIHERSSSCPTMSLARWLSHPRSDQTGRPAAAARWCPSAVLVGAVGAAAPLALVTTPGRCGHRRRSAATPSSPPQGGVFNFGAAPAVGRRARRRRTSAVVGVAPDSTGKGYWVATANGGVFTFGDAKFYGSARRHHAQRADRGHRARPRTARGYYLVAADGGVFTFGDAKFYGSAGT